MIEFGVDKTVLSEWLVIRKNKKLTNTETAFNKFIKQVEKSGYSINEVLEKCIEKSWGGFESDWFKKDLTSGYRKPTGGIRDSGLAF